MKTLSHITSRPLRSALAAALAFAVPATALALPSPAAAQSSDTLDQVVGALRAITTMKADFIQEDRSGQAVRGVLTLKNPGKMRFEYEKAANMLIVANGRSLTMVDYDVQRAERLPMGPLAALFDPKRDVKRYGKLLPTTNPNVISVEVRDTKRPEYGVITLIFVRKPGAPGGLELTNWVALDAQNKRTTVRLSNHRYGMAVADSAFTYRDPSGGSRRPR
jgi:outer membrane lipoprotein-sorting protein